jgi:hypothetical protein
MVARMTRPSENPSKDRLKEMTLGEIDQYIRSLRDELQWQRSGPVHKVRVKQLEVATKVRALNYPSASSGR